MHKENYYKYFETSILSEIQHLENYRISTLKKMILTSCMFFLTGIVFLFLFLYLSFYHKQFFLLFPVLLFFMYTFFLKSIIKIIWTEKNYNNWLLENVLPLFFKPVANFKFWPKNNDIKSILDSNLFKNIDTQEDVSAIFGIYKNTNIIISNTKLKLPTKGINKPNLFNGTLIQLELQKPIDNHVIFISKNTPKSNNFKQIKTNIQDMDKFLYTFAKNSNDINFITENFWKNLKKLGEYYIAKDFRLSYNKNVILIAIGQKKPWFFGSIYKSLLDKKNFDEIINRFTAIYNLVDYITQDG